MNLLKRKAFIVFKGPGGRRAWVVARPLLSGVAWGKTGGLSTGRTATGTEEREGREEGEEREEGGGAGEGGLDAH